MTRRWRLLAIDDNQINLLLISYLIEAQGWNVSTATDGAEGLARMRASAFDAVLCDIQMPEMDGFEFARQVRQDPALRDSPLVAVTALAMVGDRERILAAGFDGYLAKPIDPARFVAELVAILPSLAPGTVPAGDRSVPSADAAPAEPSGPTILVVDDSPFNLELKRGLLEPHGFRVLTAADPDAALPLARAHRPALIVSDVGMQHASGFEFIAAVKADPNLRDIPFIFLSATHWDEASRQRALALGARCYLKRPMDTVLLLREIRRGLGVPQPRQTPASRP